MSLRLSFRKQHTPSRLTPGQGLFTNGSMLYLPWTSRTLGPGEKMTLVPSSPEAADLLLSCQEAAKEEILREGNEWLVSGFQSDRLVKLTCLKGDNSLHCGVRLPFYGPVRSQAEHPPRIDKPGGTSFSRRTVPVDVT